MTDRVFDFKFLTDELRCGAEELAAYYGVRTGDGCPVHAYKCNHLKVKNNADCIDIGYSDTPEFMRGLVKAFNGEDIEEKRAVERLDFLAECAGGSVLSVKTVKRFVRFLAAAGYTGLLLGITDVYKIKGQRMFGYMKGAYTEEELKEIDEYASIFGIEIIPCIQTLAHLGSLFRWPDYYSINDCNDILLCDSEETYKLIDDMFAQLSRSFSSRAVHLGMDEAFLMGSGRHLELYGYEDRTKIFLRHLRRVLDIADKHGFQRFMGWADCFANIINNTEKFVGMDDMNAILGKYADKVTVYCYQYSIIDKDYYIDLIKKYKNVSSNIGFGGAAWRWTGFSPNNKFSVNVAKAAMAGCIESGVKNVLPCAWSDDGGECSIFAVLPSAIAYSECAYGGNIEKAFKNIVGYDIDEFYALDLPNVMKRNPAPTYRAGYAKNFLYNDLLLGVFDTWAKDEFKDVMTENLSVLKNLQDDSGEFGYLFKVAYTLTDAIAAKYHLGVEIMSAYKMKDKSVLSALSDKISVAVSKVRVFYEAFMKQWYLENKAFGAEIHDIRIGGVINRMNAVKQRLDLYVNGEIDKIEELEEEKINWLGKVEDGNWIHYNEEVGDLLCNGWKISSTTNNL